MPDSDRRQWDGLAARIALTLVVILVGLGFGGVLAFISLFRP